MKRSWHGLLVSLPVSVIVASAIVAITQCSDITGVTIVLSLVECSLCFVLMVGIWPLIIRILSVPYILYPAFLLLYFTLGLLPLSTYRDYIDTRWWFEKLALSAGMYLIGWFVAWILTGRKATSDCAFDSCNIAQERPLRRWFNLLVVGCALSAILYIIMAYGIVLLHPDRRFGEPAKLLYTAEFLVPVSVSFMAYRAIVNSQLGGAAKVAAISAVLVSLPGYRNDPMLVLLSFIITAIHSVPAGRLASRSVGVAVSAMISVGAFLFTIAYLVRTGNSSHLLPWEEMISTYNIVYPEIVAPLIPVHLNAREDIGVAQVVIDRGFCRFLSPYGTRVFRHEERTSPLA